MLYILECMMLLIVGMSNDMVMGTTGEEPSGKEVGVAVLGWLIVLIIAGFIVYLIRYFSCKNKKYNYSNERTKIETFCNFFSGILNVIFYILECMFLCVLCLHGGTSRKMKSTGKKPTKKEVALCFGAWLLLIEIIGIIVLICIFW